MEVVSWAAHVSFEAIESTSSLAVCVNSGLGLALDMVEIALYNRFWDGSLEFVRSRRRERGGDICAISRVC